MVAYYIFVFLGSVVCSLLLTRLVRDWAIPRGWLDRPSPDRHLHLKPVPRIGGVALFLGFGGGTAVALVTSTFLEGRPFPTQILCGIFLPSVVVFFTGLYDDVRGLGPYWKFGIETIAAVGLYLSGLGVHRLDLFPGHGVLRISLSLPITIFWVLLITNAFNLIDGLDGLAAGSALFSTLIIFVVSLWRHTPLISYLSVALAGSILGFLRYNFYPATIFLGDSGSLVIGFLLGALALTGSQKATTALAVGIPVVSFGLPILDVTLSVFRRYVSSKPLFLGDDEHIHHKLIKRGLSHRNAVLVLYAVAAAFGLLSLTLLHGEMMLGVVLIVIGIGVWWGIQELKYLEFYELAATVRHLRQRRRVMANNLRLRRTIELLGDRSLQFPEICQTLQVALEPLGFSGATLDIPTGTQLGMSASAPDSKARFSYLWGQRVPVTQRWELKVELISRRGNKLGHLLILRNNASEPLRIDMDLLQNDFCAAVSEAIDRAIGLGVAVPAAQARSRAVLSAKAAAVSSQ
jgi:UDP-GlcNAc:undecaprenyl-phosphate/decaprenyl-phosphate GlcNAc-1-phosphate transferase